MSGILIVLSFDGLSSTQKKFLFVYLSKGTFYNFLGGSPLFTFILDLSYKNRYIRPILVNYTHDFFKIHKINKGHKIFLRIRQKFLWKRMLSLKILIKKDDKNSF